MLCFVLLFGLLVVPLVCKEDDSVLRNRVIGHNGDNSSNMYGKSGEPGWWQGGNGGTGHLRGGDGGHALGKGGDGGDGLLKGGRGGKGTLQNGKDGERLCPQCSIL